jgi:2,4-didehydro-3-deoxy-L-rhamnonate hydrolase
MKLLRYGEVGAEKPAILLNNGTVVDVSKFINDYNEDFFSKDGIEQLHAMVNSGKLSLCPKVPDGVRIGACIARPSKVICVGLNYHLHAKETNAEVPKAPILFFKSTTSICGAFDNVVIPKNASKLDWEVELAVIIGKRASYVEVADAANYIAGYCVMNDYSERDFQLNHQGQWCKGKGCDTFGPIGPWMVTKDEVKDPQNLNLWLKVNDKTMQNSNTSDMIFDVNFLVHYISQFMTLLPGDVISTGTPSGVGLGLKPPHYLKANDKVSLGISGLGEQIQLVANYN